MLDRPSKYWALPVLVSPNAISDTAHIERVGETFADRRACRALSLDPVEHVGAFERDRFHAGAPEREFHGRLIDRRETEHGYDVEADGDERVDCLSEDAAVDRGHDEDRQRRGDARDDQNR